MAIAAPEPVETPPLSMAPGLGTIGGAPTDADSQAKPADPPAPAAKTPAKDADPQYPGAIPVGPKPEARKDPDYPGAIPVDQPKQSAPPQYPGATIPGSPPPVAVPAPTPAFTPPEAAQPSISPPPPANLPVPQAQPPVPTPTPESSTPDPHELQQVLKAQGISPGAAQAVAAGQIPKTISGNIPAPPKPQPSPAPADETQPDKSSTASGEIPGDTDTAPPAATSIAPSAPAKPAATTPITPQAAKAFVLSTIPKSDTQSIAGVNQMFQKGQLQTREDGSIWWQQPDETATQIANSASDIQGGKPSTTSTAPAAPSASTTDEPKTVVGDGMLKGTATSFGLNYDGSYDKDDNGIGFFGGVNTRNPKLKAVAVPVDVLETAFGKFTKKLPDGTYAPLDTPEAQKIIQAIRSAHVEAQGLDGKIHSFPIVDIQGSLGGHPGKVLDMTPAAGRELGFNDNHSVSYQIVGGDGKPYAIPADQLAGWNSGGGKSDSGKSGGKSSDPFAGQPLFSIPVAGSGGSESRPPSPQASSFGGGGGGGGSSQAAPQGDSGGSGGAGAFLGGAAAGALVANAMSGRGGQQQSQPVDSSASVNPMVQALINRGFTPQQAQLYAQGVQNIAPGKGIGPLQVGAPPPAPSAPAQLPSTQLNIRPQQGVTPKLFAPKQLMPGKVPKIVPGPPPAAPGAPAAQAGPSQAVDPSVVLGLIKSGFTREQALAFAGKATVSQASPVTGAANFRPPQSSAKTPAISASTPQQQAPARQPQAAQAPPPPAPPPKDQPKQKAQPVQAEPTEFTGRPAGSTHGDPNPPGMEELSGSLKDQGAQHAGLLSGDDPRVKKQKDGYIKGEHFVEGDLFHDQLLSGLPYGKQGRQRGILGQGETAIADKQPMHISYISAPQEAEKFPTRESRKVQYDAHSPEARLMGTTEGQLVGHSMIPLSVGVKLPDKKGEKAGDPHQGYIQGLSTNILANNFQHLNDKLSAMGRKTPYKELGAKFSNDLEGYFHNLLAGHTATGSGYAIGTEDHPNEPDREHVPYMLTRKEADFIGTVINNDAAFSKHEDAKKIRELARANGTLITEKGETNRLQHDIEQHEPGWRKRVLEHAVKTFRAGLIHEIHPTEEHMPESIRPGKGYQALTKALARTSERGRPDVAVGASLHHTFQDNAKINKIERDFSEHRIDEAEARNQIKALGEDPEDYRFIGGSGGLITPYEDDPEAITPEEHTQMKDNLRQQWVGGKLGVDDYRKKAAEVPLPSKPSQPKAPKAAAPVETPEAPAPPVPKPLAPKPPRPPKPKAPPSPEPEGTEAPKEKPATEKLYRGMATGGQGHYYSPDKEWARQFTQSGQDHEIQERHVKTDDIHEPDEPIEANDVEGVDKAISDAKTAGKKAVRLSEGKEQPDSVHVFDKSALIHPSKVAAIAKPKEAAPPAVAPAPDEPLPPVAKKPKAAKPVLEQVSAAPKPTATAALEKPSWKTANEKTRQAYLKQRVAQDLEKQYKGPDAHPLEVDRNDDKSIKYDPAGNPMYKKIDYDLANSPLLKKKGLKQIKDADKHEDTLGNLIGPDGKEVIDPETGKPVLKHAHLNQTERRRLSAMHTASAVHTMGNKIVDEFMKIKDIPEIAAGEGWYSRMRKKLADALGEHHELFAQLLGATSAKTPVRNNFIQSLDALEQYKSGKFDNHIKKYLEGYEKMREGKGALVAHMKSLGIPLYDKDGNAVETHKEDAAAMANWIHHHGILPRQQIQPGQEEGSKYNANSIAVLKALAGTWLKEVGAPKTPNFAGNLTGRTLEATIDVWAARFLKRLGYEGHGPGPWRAQGKSEPGVNSLDFAFSQDAMRHAADEITRRTGKKMNPDDLQAIAWFAEKHHWEKQGWTRGAGAEKSSFDDVADLAFPKTGEPMTSADLRKHYGAIQEEAKRVKARVKTAKNYVGHADPKMRAKLEPYMEKHGLTHEQVHGPEVEEEDEDEAA